MRMSFVVPGLNLILREVFVYYDQPLLFVADDWYGRHYLCVAAKMDSHNKVTKWICAQVTDSTLAGIRDNTLDYYSVYRATPELLVTSVTPSGTWTDNYVLASSVPDSELPAPGAYLNPVPKLSQPKIKEAGLGALYNVLQARSARHNTRALLLGEPRPADAVLDVVNHLLDEAA
jgi:hypothetical protein